MSGDFHQRAVCPCGWNAICSFGKLAHLTWHGSFINVCPACGADKHGMTVRVLRWQDGTWRDRNGKPFDDREPTPSKPLRTVPPETVVFLTVLAIVVIIMVLSL